MQLMGHWMVTYDRGHVYIMKRTYLRTDPCGTQVEIVGARMFNDNGMFAYRHYDINWNKTIV